MGYVLPQEEEEEQQQQQVEPTAPKLGGAQSFGGASGGGGQAPATETPKSQNAQSKGSGFTNLTNWLDAGKGRDKGITAKSTGLLSAEKDTFGKALAPVKDATFTAKSVDHSNVNKFTDTFGKAAGGDAGAKTEISGMISQKYDGPRDVNYNANAQKNLWDTASLTSADTAGQVLARPQIEAGQYGAGMQRLDNVLFGADSASRGAMDTAKKDLTSFGDTVKTDTKAMMDKVTGFDAAADAGNKSTDAALKKIGADMSDALDRDVAVKQSEEKQQREALADGYVQDATSPTGYRKAGGGESVGAITGGGANRDNVASAQQKSGFALLNEMLGTEKLQDSGPYAGVKAETVKDPNYVPPAPTLGDHVPRPFTAMEMVKNENPEHAKILQDAWFEYGPKNTQQLDTNGWQEFYARFQREHPEVYLPTGEAADAYEQSAGAGVNDAGDYLRNRKAK